MHEQPNDPMRPRSTPGPDEPGGASDARTAKQVSLWALVLAAAGIGFLLFRFIQPFFASLFLAAVFALLLSPLNEWISNRLWRRRRLAALLIVVLVVAVLTVVSGVLLLAGRELVAAGKEVAAAEISKNPAVLRVGATVEQYLPGIGWEEVHTSVRGGVETFANDTVRRTGEYLTNVVHAVVSAVILCLALYYFLAEGPSLMRAFHAVSPFAMEDERELIRKFAAISRGVVMGTVVCAVVQAVLLGVGLAIAGVERVWMLAGLTLLLSMIPFIGAAGVWAPVSVWLLWDGRIAAGALLALYGTTVVSTSDNLIRAYVLKGSAKLHPLLALASALGALQVVGLWGIFLGPMVAAFFYSILKILHDRLQLGAGRPIVTGED